MWGDSGGCPLIKGVGLIFQKNNTLKILLFSQKYNPLPYKDDSQNLSEKDPSTQEKFELLDNY